MREEIETMKEIIRSREAEWTALRRDFHRYPETGWTEMRTSAVIHERLSSLGYTVLTGRQAVLPEARMGVPDRETLRTHAAEAEHQEGTPLAYLTQDMKEGLTGVIGILDRGPGPVVALRCRSRSGMIPNTALPAKDSPAGYRA